MSEIRVEAIHIHPVKSCRRIEVDTAEIVATGLAHDREWQIVDDEGNCVTQRNRPELATVETTLDDDDVILSAPGRGSVKLSTKDAPPVTVLPLVGRRPVNAVDGGDREEVSVTHKQPQSDVNQHGAAKYQGISPCPAVSPRRAPK